MHSRPTGTQLTKSAVVGILTGLWVALFKLSIESVHTFCYARGFWENVEYLLALAPVIGGGLVGVLLLLGGPFPAGMQGIVTEVDQESRTGNRKLISETVKDQCHFFRKSIAAIFTLGTGNSLGPEGPCVDIGLNVAQGIRAFYNGALRARDSFCISGGGPQTTTATATTARAQRHIYDEQQHTWNMMLLSCGASAGVAAGFNAPIAGVFFALEIIQNAIHAIEKNDPDPSNPATRALTHELKSVTTATTITPVLISSILSALVSRSLLGNHLTLTVTKNVPRTPLIEMPLYLILGSLSGSVAFCFSRCVRLSQGIFEGAQGPKELRKVMRKMPNYFKPILGGMLCGAIGVAYPRIRFFGYETLNSLLKNDSPLSTGTLVVLLVLKLILTALCTGSGLVGGHFAPSLFMGATLGAAFQNIVSYILQAILDLNVATINQVKGSKHVIFTYIVMLLQRGGRLLQLTDVPIYAMAGAASVLAALFRAPLTATMLLFEATRSYDAILPLMASAGVASLVGHMLEDFFEDLQQQEEENGILPQWQAVETVSSGDDGDDDNNSADDSESMSPLSSTYTVRRNGERVVNRSRSSSGERVMNRSHSLNR